MKDDDYDMGEVYAFMRACSVEKRSNNRVSSATMLESYKIPFVTHNNGSHLVITYEAPPVVIDFWPGTGLWKVRHTKLSRRGVRNLINYIRSFATLDTSQ